MTSFAEKRRWAILLVLVLASFGLNAFNLWRDWEHTLLPVLVVLLVLGFVLPVLAIFLVWRGRVAGAWILVILFDTRGVANLVLVVTYARSIFIVLDPIVIRHAILGAFFVASAVWIALSAVMGVWSWDIRRCRRGGAP
jgi:hypothetical protein